MINDTFVFNKQFSIRYCCLCEFDNDSMIDDVFALKDQCNIIHYVPCALFGKEAMEFYCLRTHSSFEIHLEHEGYNLSIRWSYYENRNYRTIITIRYIRHQIYMLSLKYSQPFNIQAYNRYLKWLKQNNLEIR